jgi:ribose transport system permease protein
LVAGAQKKPRFLPAFNLKEAMPLVALILLAIIFGSVNPRFLSLQNLVNLIRQSAPLLIVAVGGTFVILMGSIDLSVAAVVSVSGILVAKTMPSLGVWSILVGLAAGALAGLLSGMLFAYGRLPSFLVTLGMMSVLQGVSLLITKGNPVPIRHPVFQQLAVGQVLGIPNLGLWALLVLVIGAVLARWTRFGRYMYAIGGGERVAKLSGIPVERFKVYAFVFAGLVAGLAGMVLTGRLGSGTVDMGGDLLLDSVAAIVMGGTSLTGGVGGPLRTVLGVAVITVLSNGLNVIGVDPFVHILTKGVVVIASVALTIDRRKLAFIK